MPADRDAFHEPLKLQLGRLIPVKDCLHDIRCQEGEAHDPADVSLGHAFLVGDRVDRWRLAGIQLVFLFVRAGQRLDKYSVDARRQLPCISRRDHESHLAGTTYIQI